MGGKGRNAIVTAVDVFFPSSGVRRWHNKVVERLLAESHDVRVSQLECDLPRESSLEAVLGLEKQLPGALVEGLWSRETARIEPAPERPAEVVLNFTAAPGRDSSALPTLTIHFDGHPELSSAAAVLARGAVPEISLRLDGLEVAHAAPMATSRVFVSRGLDSVLARAVTLIVAFISSYDPSTGNQVQPHEHAPPDQGAALGRKLIASYALSAVPRFFGRAFRRIRYYGGHWKVGYRFVDGPGVAETRSLAGAPWTVLPDPGDRFYADPFPFELDGRYFVFVEELVHARPKGVISVSECGSDGEFGRPTPILEEPFHLSYPQVFSRDGEIWMIPETGGGRKLSLYRAVRFPDRWQEEQVLIADRELFDATLLDHGGLCWLFATERDGAGDPSDTLVVYFSESMMGPWRPHQKNPIVIDKSAARPGGRFVHVGNEVLLPLQDGTDFYGCGLGVSSLERLDLESVELSQPTRIDSLGHWPYPHIHTLNRHGRLETIDGFTESAKRSAV